MHTRRTFLAAATPLVAATLSPYRLPTHRRAPTYLDGTFPQGVMAGEPTPHGITLWTHVADVDQPGRLRLEVATDPGFRRVVEATTTATRGELGYNAHVRVKGLDPYEQYYYRFATRSSDSPVGRFRTALPPDSRQPVRIAFWSCQDYTHGYFNAHDVMADGDYDLAVCLGDYIYAETFHTVAEGVAVRDDLVGTSEPAFPRVLRAAHTLDDYRAKYALYRSDPGLRRMQQSCASVVLADDHEVQDNYAGAAVGGGLPAVQGYTEERRVAAIRAFREAMPLIPRASGRVYRALRFGRNLELLVTDQRTYRADQPCRDGVSKGCPELEEPRAFLGEEQLAWLKRRLSDSQARWKVIANETMAMSLRTPTGAFLGFDSWQGYPAERRELLTHIRDADVDGVAFVTGDIHTFFAGDVRIDETDPGSAVAPEFVGGSISSPGAGEIAVPLQLDGSLTTPNPDAPVVSDAIVAAMLQNNPYLRKADFVHHGYGELTLSADRLRCDMVRVPTVRRREQERLPLDGWRFDVEPGQRSLVGA